MKKEKREMVRNLRERERERDEFQKKKKRIKKMSVVKF